MDRENSQQRWLLSFIYNLLLFSYISVSMISASNKISTLNIWLLLVECHSRMNRNILVLYIYDEKQMFIKNFKRWTKDLSYLLLGDSTSQWCKGCYFVNLSFLLSNKNSKKVTISEMVYSESYKFQLILNKRKSLN